MQLMNKSIFRALLLVACIFLCLSAGFIGSYFTMSQISSWYSTLQKPIWTPPNWLFGPVWTLLYIMMGVSLWLVVPQAGRRGYLWALSFFAAQLALNTMWSIIFFGWHQTGWAFVEIVALWIAILATIVSFWPISRVAALLLVPYLVWVSYASALNFAIWSLNG